MPSVEACSLITSIICILVTNFNYKYSNIQAPNCSFDQFKQINGKLLIKCISHSDLFPDVIPAVYSQLLGRSWLQVCIQLFLYSACFPGL